MVYDSLECHLCLNGSRVSGCKTLASHTAAERLGPAQLAAGDEVCVHYDEEKRRIDLLRRRAPAHVGSGSTGCSDSASVPSSPLAGIHDATSGAQYLSWAWNGGREECRKEARMEKEGTEDEILSCESPRREADWEYLGGFVDVAEGMCPSVQLCGRGSCVEVCE